MPRLLGQVTPSALRRASQPRELQLTHFLAEHLVENIGREASSTVVADTVTELGRSQKECVKYCLLTRVCAQAFCFWTREAQQWTI